MEKITNITFLFICSICISFIGMSDSLYANSNNENLTFAPDQPAGFVVFDNVGGEPVNSGEVFLAVGPNQVEENNISYRLFYSKSNETSEDPTTLTEYTFGTTAGDGDGTAAFGFRLTGLDPGTDYTFYLYQFDSSDNSFSTPSVVTQTSGGESGNGDGGGDNEVVTGFDVIQDFEDESTFSFADFEGLGGATLETAPSGSNGISFKLESLTSGNPWQGAEIVQNTNLLDLRGDKTVEVDVYSTQAFNLLLKVEDGGPNSAASQSYTTPNEWQTLTFTMDESLDGTTVANGVYEKIVFFPNWNGTDTGFDAPQDFTLYIDNVKGFTNQPDDGDDEVVTGFDVIQDFEDESTFSFADFEGLGGATLETAPSGSNGISFKLESLTTGNPWQGAEIVQNTNLLDLRGEKTVEVDVYSTQAFNLLLKVEDGGLNSAASQSYTTPNEWQTLTFTMDESLDGTAVANGVYEKIVFFPNWNGTDTGFDDPQTFTVYIDNVKGFTSQAGEGDGGNDGDPGEIGEETLTVDANATWSGYANVFDLPSDGGDFVFGNDWGLNDLRTVVNTEANTLTLFPNFNTYDAGDPFWTTPGGEGNKIFEGVTRVESTALAGKVLTFRGNVESFTISSDYEVTAFIRVFNADFSFNKAAIFQITQTGEFEVVFDDVDLENDVNVQYGFTVIGVNANPADEAQLGNVVVGPTTLSSRSFEPIEVQVYPNPVSDVLQIKSTSNFSSVELYSLSGRLLVKQANAEAIDMRSLSNGMYLLKLTSEGNSITKKVIKN